MNKHTRVWPLQEAKAKLSELIDLVEDGSEQLVSRHGKAVARVLPIAKGQASAGKTGADFVAMLDASPLRNSKLHLGRRLPMSSKPRKVDLS